jgi:hypothetical protein
MAQRQSVRTNVSARARIWRAAVSDEPPAISRQRSAVSGLARAGAPIRAHRLAGEKQKYGYGEKNLPEPENAIGAIASRVRAPIRAHELNLFCQFVRTTWHVTGNVS